MRTIGLIVGAMLLANGLAIGSPSAQVTWAARVGALTPLLDVEAAGPTAPDTRSVPVLVASVYARLGVPAPSDAQAAQLAAEARALGPQARLALQELLGAIDLALADASAEGAAVRLVRAIDAAAPMLLEADLAALPSTQPFLFPGPNTGLLFNDPVNLILIGGPGPGVYRGNTYTGFVAPEENLLTLDLGGDDIYEDHAGTAHPLPDVVCGPCHDGLPVSLTIDVGGNDGYVPRTSSQNDGALGLGAFGGVGVLADLGGDDAYVVDFGLGDGESRGVGLLLDAAGDDTYQSGAGAQGFAADGGLGVLLDLAGADSYKSAQWSRGFTFGESTAVFFDACGDDHYWNAPGANGAMWQQTAMGYGVDRAC